MISARAPTFKIYAFPAYTNSIKRQINTSPSTSSSVRCVHTSFRQKCQGPDPSEMEIQVVTFAQTYYLRVYLQQIDIFHIQENKVGLVLRKNIKIFHSKIRQLPQTNNREKERIRNLSSAFFICTIILQLVHEEHPIS